jgi:hypothetical protein
MSPHIVSLVVCYFVMVIVFLAIINRKVLIAKWQEQKRIYRYAALKFWRRK